MQNDAGIDKKTGLGQDTHHADRLRPTRHLTGPGRTIPRLSFPEQLVLWSSRRLATIRLIDVATEAEAEACRNEIVGRVGKELG